MQGMESKIRRIQLPQIEAPLPRDAAGEILNDGPLGTRQNWAQYSEEEHDVWRTLFTRQRANLEEIAYTPWLDAADTIGLTADGIPLLSAITERLYPLTRWQPVPISGFLDATDYFSYLAKRQFPTVVSIRKREQLEFCVEPDVFHDAFGHLPMHSHSTFADFLELFGKTALSAETEEQMTEMQRLYWFTVEYGMISEGGKLKICGSGHMSGIKEARFSLTSAVEKRPFVLEDVCRQPFNPHILQTTLFVLESFDQLFEAMEIKAREFGVPLNG